MIFENLKNRQIYWLLLLHLFVGFLFFLSNYFLDLWYYGVVLAGLSNIITKQNRNNAATVSAAYIVGLEVVARMVHGHVPWEGGKYAVSLLLFMGMQVETRRRPPSVIIIYFVLLLPALALIDYPDPENTRMHISFNMSGPLCLTLSTLYFTGRIFTIRQLRILFLAIVLPLISTCVCILLRAPNLADIRFDDAANIKLSGGFGPNQVSILLAFGVTIMIAAFFLGFKVTHTALSDRIITFILFLFCIINFSRGGVVTAAICTIVGAIVWYRYSNSTAKNTFFLSLSLIIIILAVGFYYFDKATGDSLSKRYKGTLYKKNPKYEAYGSGFSGREDIVGADFIIFLEHPVLGSGVAMAEILRTEILDHDVGAHTEFSRLLAEHGVLGLMAFLILIFLPYSQFRQSEKFYEILFLTMFATFSLVAELHTGMRLAMSGFSYGIAFIKLIPERLDQFDPVLEYRQKSMMWQQFEKEQLA